MESITLSSTNRSFHYLNRTVKRTSLDIQFKNLKYSVKDVNSKNGHLQILKLISGKFCSGQLTAILGPSGAGKTTLLNVLAGYIQTSKIKGVIEVNKQPRDMAVFNKMSSYIMQDNKIQPYLTVKEAMIFSACLKLGPHITYENKITIVEEVINFLGLDECTNTLSERLSGGEKKRLAIALELVNNPPVIFLDEPTTGLDNFSAKQCIELLKQISQLGRTVICTIHQPPSSLFQYFDQVYVIADGFCVYSGTPSCLVPFLSSIGHSCPSNNTPAEYIIELVHQTPSVIGSLKNETKNGKIAIKDDEDKASSSFVECSGDNKQDIMMQKSDTEFPTSFQVQFFVLLSRMFLQAKRNKIPTYLVLFQHITVAFGIVGIFGRIGNNASRAYEIFMYCMCCNLCFLYTYLMIPILVFPSEVKLLKTEYFNRWYTLKAYYLAMMVSSLPLPVIAGTLFSAIVYFLTDQPAEMNRFLGFCLMNLMVGFTSHAVGQMVGAVFNEKKGIIVGSTTLGMIMMISVYGLGHKGSIHLVRRVLMKIMYLRYGIEGVCSAVFYKREPLTCEEDFCYYARPEVLMRDNSIVLTRYEYYLFVLSIFLVMFRVGAYLLLKCRLNPKISQNLRVLCRRAK